MKALPQGYQRETEQRFALNCEDAVQINYYPDCLEIRSQTQIITNYFKLQERLEKFASAET